MRNKQKQNGHSKPEDFLMPEIPEIEEHTLPSGLQVRLRPPVGMEFWARIGQLPGAIGSRGEQPQEPDPEALIKWANELTCALIVEPRFSQHPAAGEFHPRRLKPRDRAWLTAYFRHYTGGGGDVLETFRERLEKSARAGQGGDALPPGSK